MNVLEVQGLTKHYPAFTLNGVSFSVSEGAVMGFIGRNGAGKSTTLKSILGMVHPDAGKVRVFGMDYAANERTIRRELGVVLGGIDFYPKKKIRVITDVTRRFYDNRDEDKYRHIKILADHSILMVVGENRIRGTVESVYQLNKNALTTEDESGNAVQMSLLSICASFARYFARGDVDPRKDMLLLTNCTLLLTDGEFSSFLSEINEITLKYMKAEVTKSSKTRQITLISAPTEEQLV